MLRGGGLRRQITPKPAAALPLSQSFRYANFKAHVGDIFSVFSKDIEGVGEVVDLQLMEVVKVHIDELTEQFSVRFSRPDDYLLPQGLYIFDSVSDEFGLYLRPDTRNKGMAYYLAELNLLLRKPE